MRTKHAFLFLLLFWALAPVPTSLAQPGTTQSLEIDVDTIHLADLQLGEPWQNLFVYAHDHVDTLIWGGEHSANIFRYSGSYLGRQGNFLVATELDRIHQLTFNFSVKDTAAAARLFEAMDAELESRYGNPHEAYTNVYRILRWNGKRQSFALQTKDGTSFVSIVLSPRATK